MARPESKPERCRRKFRRYFRRGFRDETYLAWERDYKWQAHRSWQEELAPPVFGALLKAGKAAEITARAVRIEAHTNLITSP